MRRSLLAVTSIIGAVAAVLPTGAADWTYNMMFSSWAVSNKYDRYHTFTPETAIRNTGRGCAGE